MAFLRTTGIRLDELAKAVNAQVRGARETILTGVNNLDGAGRGDLVCVTGARFIEAARRSKAGAFLVATPLENFRRPQLITPNPQYDFNRLINQFFTIPRQSTGIAEGLWQGEEVEIGPDASIGPFVTLGHRAKIGARVTLFPGVYVGDDAQIGDDSIVHPNAAILERCIIGSRVIVHCGTVIGSEGFGYVQHEGRHHKIPQLGNVILEDDVELGANVTIDRGTFGHTIVKRGTKVDNLVQIAHNVAVGEDCILIAQVGIAGSTKLGNHVMVGGQAGLVEHITVGDRAMIAAGAGVERNLDPGAVVAGRPAVKLETALKTGALLYRLPELRHQIIEMEKRIRTLESQPRQPKVRKSKKR